MGNTCSFPECGKIISSKGYCSGHYSQLLRGEVVRKLKHKRKEGSPPVIKYKIVPCKTKGLKGPCHEWYYSKDENGYGRVSVNRKMISVHKYIWERKFGPVPKGLVIDHQCRNRACCNISHLRVVTQQVNLTENVVGMSWQKHAAKTHCKNGHEFTEQNTYWRTDKWRTCRKCRHIGTRKIQMRKRREFKERKLREASR